MLNVSYVIALLTCTPLLDIFCAERDASYTQPHGDDRGIHVELRAEPAAGKGATCSPYEFVWFRRNERQPFVYQVDAGVGLALM